MHEALLSYLREHGKNPVDYVLSKFEQYDIVLLGEMHMVQQQLELYHKLIPRLPELGVGFLAYEFARREDQPLIDELLDKAEFDIPPAKKIMIRQEALWGFQEYLDVFRILWSVNRQLPASRKIRLLGLNDPYNWKLYNHICRTEQRKPNAEERDIIWKDCDERYWADTVGEHYSPGKTKVLGIMGSHHAFTKYREPDWQPEGDHKVFTGFKVVRFGNHLYERYPDNVFNICFHDPWENKGVPHKLIHPAGGLVEELIAPYYQEIAFDLKDSPWGELPDDSFYALGYADFKIGKMFDGMVYTGRLQDLRPVTAIPDFIDEDNIGLFRDYAAFNMEADKSIAEINAVIQEDAKLYE